MKISLRWQMAVVILSLIAILASLVLRIDHPKYADIPLLFVIIIAGLPLVVQILLKMIKGDLGADLLAAIALITAVILGEYLAASLIVLMLSSGQALESYATRKASSALLALVERMPSIAHRKIKEGIEDIPLSEVGVNDIIVIYPHEICPVDGVVLEGRGPMDESYLTGEPYQIDKAPGTSVLSGAINGAFALTVQATKKPADSRYAAIVKVLQQAELKRPKLRRLGDQIGAVFAPLALLFAALAWYLSGEKIRFLSVLVIATPCPLLIAIPITIIAAISLAARKGIIIKDPAVLEKLPTCRTAIFDKTGTLTYGKPVLAEIVAAKDREANFVLEQTASLERYSKHPLAGAILDAAKKAGLTLRNVSYVSEEPGHGLTGTVLGHRLQITGRQKLINSHPEIYALLPKAASGLECVVLIDNQYAATLRFRDMPRQESKDFVSHLKPVHRFNKVMLVSGDRESEVNYLGQMLNLTEVYASQTPEQKLDIVRAECTRAPTLFMGDGINDAPALTAATVGIAFGQASNVTAEASGAVILENSLYKVDTLMHLSLYTRKIALQSALGGMLLSMVGMGFAAAGFITPVAGAILQEAIDVLAILNALRLAWKTHIGIDL